jgi:hypothetical protein
LGVLPASRKRHLAQAFALFAPLRRQSREPILSTKFVFLKLFHAGVGDVCKNVNFCGDPAKRGAGSQNPLVISAPVQYIGDGIKRKNKLEPECFGHEKFQ